MQSGDASFYSPFSQIPQGCLMRMAVTMRILRQWVVPGAREETREVPHVLLVVSTVI
jgi:hypothetical protein